MKFFLFLNLALALPLLAAPPKEPQLTRYTRLWTDSPFTAKPPPPTAPEAINPFEGYSLGGVTKLKDGYFVVVLNDKDPEKKVLIRPGYKSEFEVVDVSWSDTNWKDTTVRVKQGSRTGTLAFDDAQLNLKAPVAATPASNVNPAAQNNNAQQQNNNNRGNNGQRRPRPRVVVPPRPNR